MIKYILALALGIFLLQTTLLNAAEVKVIRGDQVEVVNTARGGKTVILRGTPAPVAKARAEKRRRAAPGTARVYAAGDVLWKRDADGSLTACWLRGTGYVGERVIRCTSW